MIRCPKCNAENQIGAIFCKSCGVKLDLNELSHDQVVKAAKSARGKKFDFTKVVRNFVSTTLLIGVLVVLAGLYIPPKSSQAELMSHLDDESKTKSIKLLNAFIQKKTGAVFGDEATWNYMLQDLFDVSEDKIVEKKKSFLEEGREGLMLTGLEFNIVDSATNTVRLIFHQTKIDQEYIKLSSYIEGPISIEDGSLSMDIQKCGIGRIPLQFIGQTKEIVIEKFTSELDANQVAQEGIARVKTMKIEVDKLTLGVGGKKKKSAKKKK